LQSKRGIVVIIGFKGAKTENDNPLYATNSSTVLVESPGQQDADQVNTKNKPGEK